MGIIANGYMMQISFDPLILTDVRYIKNIEPLKVLWSMEFPTSSKQKVIKWHANYRNM